MSTPFTVLLTLKGEFDIADRDRLNEAFAQLPDGARVIVDLSGVDYFDSTVIAALIHVSRRITEHGGSMTLTAPQPNAARILSICHMGDIVEIRDQPANLPVDEERSLEGLGGVAAGTNSVTPLRKNLPL